MYFVSSAWFPAFGMEWFLTADAGWKLPRPVSITFMPRARAFHMVTA